jgi:hypothetical protein
MKKTKNTPPTGNMLFLFGRIRKKSNFDLTHFKLNYTITN